MTRISKQNKRRKVSPKRPSVPSKKTGPKNDALPEGFKVHPNALQENKAKTVFIPKIK